MLKIISVVIHPSRYSDPVEACRRQQRPCARSNHSARHALNAYPTHRVRSSSCSREPDEENTEHFDSSETRARATAGVLSFTPRSTRSRLRRSNRDPACESNLIIVRPHVYPPDSRRTFYHPFSRTRTLGCRPPSARVLRPDVVHPNPALPFYGPIILSTDTRTRPSEACIASESASATWPHRSIRVPRRTLVVSSRDARSLNLRTAPTSTRDDVAVVVDGVTTRPIASDDAC